MSQKLSKARVLFFNFFLIPARNNNKVSWQAILTATLQTSTCSKGKIMNESSCRKNKSHKPEPPSLFSCMWGYTNFTLLHSDVIKELQYYYMELCWEMMRYRSKTAGHSRMAPLDDPCHG